MGLLVDDNGHYRGWLAAFLCCCAAMNEDEYPSERERDKAACKQSIIRPTRTHTDNDIVSSKESAYCKQPQLTALPSSPPINAALVQNDKTDKDVGSRCDSRQSDPVSSLPRSFHFDPDYLLPQLATKDTDKPGSQLPQSPTYDPTSPTRRTRLNRSESIQKKSLVPLPLGPVVLREPSDTVYATNQTTASREAPNVTHRHQGSDSTQSLLGNASLPPYQETRETPYQRCGRQSTETLTKRASPTDSTAHTQAPSPSVRLFPQKANTPSPSLSTSLLQHARDLSTSSSHSTLVDQRPTRNTPRLQRKRSNQSKGSFGNAEDSDVEKEVLELNTIVEERRAENNKNRSPTGHVPAVAPSMEVRARSQTLTDIGSALSRPLAASSQNDVRPATSHKKEVGGSQSPKSNSRVPGWLSSVTPTTNTTNVADKNINTNTNTTIPSTATQTRTTEPTTPHVPTYRPTTATNPTLPPSSSSGHETNDRPTTPASASSSLIALDSVVAYTLEPSSVSSSSPTKSSKRYSRSLMITPLSKNPPVIEDFVIRSSSGDDNDNDGSTVDDDIFGGMGDERRVGVAL
jgi:hypothetical protein